MNEAAIVEATGLAAKPLDAAAQFHAEIVPKIRAALATESALTVLFAPANHSHDAWRKAAIQELAREAAPARVNALVGDPAQNSEQARTLQFLCDSPGITGQVFTIA